MRPPRLLSSLVLIGTLVTGCAALEGIGRDAGDRDTGARDDLAAGFDAAGNGEYGRARDRLAAVTGAGLDADAAVRAQLVLAAIDLDPRNPERSPMDGVLRLARLLLSEHSRGDPARPVAATLYLLALDGGAPDYRPGTGASDLPRLPHAPTAERLLRVRQQRDSLRGELHTLETLLEVRTRALAEARGELARIRELLKR